MKPTGIVRKLDPIGRITLPSSLREEMSLSEGTELEILTDTDAIILKSTRSTCIFCGKESKLVSHRGKNVCEACILEIVGKGLGRAD